MPRTAGSGDTGSYCPACCLCEITSLPLSGSEYPNVRGGTLKRAGGLFDQVFTRENLYHAYLDARKGKRSKKATFEFEKHLSANLDDLHREIHNGSYRPRPYLVFQVTEPKPRTIHAPEFRDIVMQHAVYRQVYAIYNRTFIDQSFACRAGMGTHKASDYTQAALRASDGDSYTLQLDIRKFFASIDRGILRSLLVKKIKDRRLIDVMMMYAEKDTETGIPIGNLLSQMYALIYLNPLDHFIKRELKIKRYVRYVDDFILIGISREECVRHLATIIRFISDKLHLSLSRSSIQKVKRGLNFVGYRTWRSRRFIRKHSMFKFKRSCQRENQLSVASILGHSCRTDSLPRLITILKGAIQDGKNLSVPKNFRRIYAVSRPG